MQDKHEVRYKGYQRVVADDDRSVVFPENAGVNGATAMCVSASDDGVVISHVIHFAEPGSCMDSMLSITPGVVVRLT